MIDSNREKLFAAEKTTIMMTMTAVFLLLERRAGGCCCCCCCPVVDVFLDEAVQWVSFLPWVVYKWYKNLVSEYDFYSNNGHKSTRRRRYLRLPKGLGLRPKRRPCLPFCAILLPSLFCCSLHCSFSEKATLVLRNDFLTLVVVCFRIDGQRDPR